MIFDNVKSIVIPEGSVKEITCNNVTLWQKIRIIIETISGVGTIVLQNVIRLIGIMQYGKCEQTSTPTPSTPIDIKCNNGTLKVVRRSGLPLGYKKLSYIESTGTQYINTGFVIPDLTNEYEVTYKMSISGGTAQGTSSNNWGYMGQNGVFMLTLTGANGIGGSSQGVPWVEDHIYEISHYRGSDASRSLTVDDTVFEFTNQAAVYADREFGIFALSPFTTVFNRIYGKLYEFKAYKNGELVMSLVPCQRLSDNAIGVYDVVNDAFIGNAGTDAFIAGADDDETYVDVVGTPEVLTVVSETTQTASVENLFGVGDYKDEQEIISGAMARACGIKILYGTEEWTTDTYGGYRRMVLQKVLTASGDTLLVICSHYISRSSDARQQPNSIFIASSGKMVIYVDSTQNFTTVDEFNAWLAEQYANGTPVIVVYPLAEETTESTTPQSFTVGEAITITATSNYINDIALSGTYETSEA